MLLKVENLSVHLKAGSNRIALVDGVQFSIDAGQSFALVGESGSGKSLTALGLLGLSPSPELTLSGKIWWNEHNAEQALDLLSLKPNQWPAIRGKKIAMVFQEPMSALNPVIRSGLQLTEVVQRHTALKGKAAKKKAFDLLEQMELTDLDRVFSSFPHQLSGGQKQRLLLAMALAGNPALLIADEPTTALDAGVQHSILQLIKRLQKEHNLSLLFISHDLGLVQYMADQVGIMQHGKIIEQGKMADIFSVPKQAYTKALLTCRPQLHTRPIRLSTISDFQKNRRMGESQKVETEQERKARHLRLFAQAPILEVSRLGKQYQRQGLIYSSRGGFRLNDVSFSLYPGESLGLVGESGSGKSTVGRCLVGLLKPDSGTVVLRNKTIDYNSKLAIGQLRKSVQIVFQDPYASLNPFFSIGSSLREVLQLHSNKTGAKAIEEQTAQLLDKVGLDPHWGKRYPHQLSGGQRQRVCIARALAAKPEILICDEAVSALDVSVQAQIINLLLDLRETQNIAILFISHDLTLVKYFCDRMLVLHKGHQVELGEADQLCSHPASHYTQSLLQAAAHYQIPIQYN